LVVAFAVILVIGSFPPASGGTAAREGTWSQWGGSAFRTHFSAGALGTSLYARWAFECPAGVHVSTAIAGETVFVGGDDGLVKAVDRVSGSLLWCFEGAKGTKIRAAPAVSGSGDVGDVVVFGAADGTVYAVDARTGAERWRFKAGLSIASAPAMLADSVVVAAYDGNVYRLKLEDGSVVWHFSIGKDLVSASPAVGGGLVYVPALGASPDGGTVYAIDEATGELRWRVMLPGWLGNSPSFAEGKVLVTPSGFKTGGVYCLDAFTGQVLWGPFKGANNYWSSPSVAAGRVLAGNTGSLYAIDLSTGREIWRWTAPSVTTKSGKRTIKYDASVRTPIIAQERVYVNTYFEVPGPSDIHVLSLETGALLGRYTAPSRVSSDLAAAGTDLLFGTLTGVVYCLSPVSIEIDGRPVSFNEVSPFIEGGKTWVPCRAFFESIGYRVSWNAATSTISCDRADSSIVIRLGSRVAVVNGVEIEMDEAPRVVNGRSVAPLRAVINALGGSVAWDPVLYAIQVRLESGGDRR